MKLARKLTFALFLALMPIIVAQAYTAILRERALFEKEIRADHHQMARALALAVVDVWRAEGEERAMSLVQSANDDRETNVQIRWVWLDVRRNDPFAPQLPPSMLAEPKASREVALVDTVHGDERLITYYPVPAPDRRHGCIEISESLAGRSRYVRESIRNVVIGAAAAAALYGIMAIVLGTWIVGNPMNELVAKARRVGSGDLSDPIPFQQSDEIGALAGELNAMCERLDATLAQLRHADRLATIGKLASGIAHELGTPLAVVSGHVRLISSSKATPEEVESGARKIGEQTSRMKGIIQQLLDFARRREPHLTDSSLKPLVEQTVEMLRPFAQRRGVRLEFEPSNGGEAMARLDGPQIQQVLTNLVMNGIQASPEGGRVAVSLSHERSRNPQQRELGEEPYVRIDVKDDGSGIATNHVGRIFEPFFTTKAPGEGTGLGLTVAEGIVRQHGGWIAVSSEPGQGSVFSVRIRAAR